MTNDAIPFWEESDRITCHAAGAITGKRLVMISADLNAGLPTVNVAAAKGRVFGVALFDAASGANVTVAREDVFPITADGAITAGVEVCVGALGKAKALGTQSDAYAIGVCLHTCADGDDAMIDLYEAQVPARIAGSEAAIPNVVDNSGGAADGTLEVIPAAVAAGGDATAAQLISVNAALTAIKNDFADLAAKYNTLLAELRTAGLIAP